MREVRFSLSERAARGATKNAWAGWPACDGLAPYVTVRAVVSGDIAPDTGYVCSTREVDELIRGRGIGHLRDFLREFGGGRGAAVTLLSLWGQIADHIPEGTRLEELSLRPTPYLAFAVQRGASEMVSMTYDFEFCAAHRLYRPELSDDENQRIFGRCTNPNGHGHNYVVRVTLQGRPDDKTGTIVPIGDVERMVNERVIDRFDHKHLNEDCAEFAELNPSVENIARVIFEKLNGAFGAAKLARVRVYETPKTYAETFGA